MFNTLTHKKMIKVLFKSEELLIAADSESAVVYGNSIKRDFKKFAEEVFEAYTNIIVEALEARMNACVNGLIQMM